MNFMPYMGLYIRKLNKHAVATTTEPDSKPRGDKQGVQKTYRETSQLIAERVNRDAEIIMIGCLRASGLTDVRCAR